MGLDGGFNASWNRVFGIITRNHKNNTGGLGGLRVEGFRFRVWGLGLRGCLGFKILQIGGIQLRRARPQSTSQVHDESRQPTCLAVGAGFRGFCVLQLWLSCKGVSFVSVFLGCEGWAALRAVGCVTLVVVVVFLRCRCDDICRRLLRAVMMQLW